MTESIRSAAAGEREKKTHLGAEQKDSPIEAENAAVIANAAVEHRHSNVTKNSIGGIIAEEVRQGFPGVVKCVHLEKMVLAAVSSELQLRSHPITSTQCLGSQNRPTSTLQVAVKVQSPLIEVARCHSHERHPICAHHSIKQEIEIGPKGRRRKPEEEAWAGEGKPSGAPMSGRSRIGSVTIDT